MDKVFVKHEQAITALIKKRERAFLWGRTTKMIELDRRIAELELEIDDYLATTSIKLTK